MNTGRLRRLLAGLTAVGSISGFLLGIEPAADPTASAVHAASAADEAAAAGAAGGRDYVGLVNPWVEADRGRFFFFQSASQPFGFVKLRPDTSTHHSRDSGYLWKENQVKGFSHIHDWQLSGVQVMPTTGSDVPKLEGDTGWQSQVDHTDGEIAEPGYHKLNLDRYDITAELTSTERVGMHRYTYRRAGSSEIIINLGGQLGEGVMENARVTKVSDRELQGYVVQRGDRAIHGSTKLFFDIRFDRPFDTLHGWADGSLVDQGRAVDEVSGENMGMYVRYPDLDAGEQVRMKVGLSLTGLEGARENLEAELPGWDFDAVQKASQQTWNELLGRIDVRGGTHRQQVKFYTDLFHVLCGRSMISDVDGAYLDDTWGAGKVRQIPLGRNGEPEYAMYNYDALWLTQWNLNTVLGMAYPEIYSSLVRSQLRMYQDGGLLPRGPYGGDYSMIMTGSAVTSFIAGAYNKGIRDFDIDLAYQAMLDAHSVGGLFDKGYSAYGDWGNGGMREYLDLGYVPSDVTAEGSGQTLEYAYQDWTLAQLAGQLGKTGTNAAQSARVRVSSELDEDSAGERAVDGRPRRAPTSTEWRSADEHNPWIQLSWDSPRRVHKVVLSDRSSKKSNVNHGILTFSDGTRQPVTRIPDNGDDRVITFDAREVEWVRFTATGGRGPEVGLNEFEVWDDTDVHEQLLQRSRHWRNVFDGSTGFSRPRNADGSWQRPFDPLLMDGFVQASSWQSTWFPVHDVMGLADQLGGQQAYADKLDYAFEQAKDDNFIAEYEGGYVSYGNQPGLEMAHLFNHVGRPWLSQYWVRQVKEKTYGSTSTTDGYGHHDEDQGQMGGLSALMAMGLFEVTGGGHSRPFYDITSPVFDEITIQLNPDYYQGERFRIVTHDNSAENMYIQRAKLDGRPLRNAWFYHDQLTDGGTLELWMGAEPERDWGSKRRPPSVSEPAPVVASFRSDSPRVDPGGSGTVGLRLRNRTDRPITVDWQVPEPEALRLTPTAGSIEVPPNDSATRKLTIRAPEGTPEGTHRIELSARTSDGTRLPEAIGYVRVAPAVSLDWAPGQLSLLRDTPATARVIIRNNDPDRANTAELTLRTPAGWTVQPRTRQVKVPAGETGSASFTVTPPADTSGSARVTVTLDADGGTAEHRIETTVSPKVALVGAIDTDAGEFALAPDGYADYPTRFSEGVDLTIGTDDPSAEWSYIQPGPSDSWAQNASRSFTLRFDGDQLPDDDLALTGWLLDTHQSSPPTLDVALNGHPPTAVEIPPGGGGGHQWDDGSEQDSVRPSVLDVDLPADQLEPGENTITLTSSAGSWLVYDAIGIRAVP